MNIFLTHYKYCFTVCVSKNLYQSWLRVICEPLGYTNGLFPVDN